MTTAKTCARCNRERRDELDDPRCPECYLASPDARPAWLRAMIREDLARGAASVYAQMRKEAQ